MQGKREIFEFDNHIFNLQVGDGLRLQIFQLKAKLDFHLCGRTSTWKPKHLPDPHDTDFKTLIRYCSVHARSLFPKLDNVNKLRMDLAWILEAKNAVYHMDPLVIREFRFKFSSAIDKVDNNIPSAPTD
jgi:hypothetical protein